MLARAYRADVTWSPLDERWYMPDLGIGSVDTGVPVSAETTLRCAAVLAAVRFKAEAVAVCTPQAFRRLAGNRRDHAPDHPVQQLLRHPNEWQTGFEWTHLMVVWLSTWGNAYNRIVATSDSFAGELRPLHPSRMRVVDQAADGSLIYEHTPLRGQKERLSQDQVHHYRGLSLDGFEGAKTYQLIRNIVSIALAVEKHIGTFLRKGTRLSGVLTTELPMSPDVQKRAEDSWQASFGGPDNTGKVAMMGGGLKFMPVTADHQKAQLMELSYHQVEQALMALGVPGVVVGYQGDKASTYASADAFFEKGGVKHCILPIVTNMEQRDEKALLLRGDPHYIKRNLDVLMRANTKDRFAALVQATGRPFMTGNEARAIEDLNPDPDPTMDAVLLPANMTTGTDDPSQFIDPNATGGPAPAGKPKPKPAPPADDEEAEARAARLVAFAEAAAARVVRREVAAIKGGPGQKGAAVRYAKDPAGWKAWATDFYDKHAGYVAEALPGMDEARARDYCARQLAAVLAGGVAAVETFEEIIAPQLAALALED
jgi:HK97 family phage portal protein